MKKVYGKAIGNKEIELNPNLKEIIHNKGLYQMHTLNDNILNQLKAEIQSSLISI